MGTTPARETDTTASALEAWRKRAVNLYTVALVLLHLPGSVLVLSGSSPAGSSPVLQALATLAYLCVVAAAVLRRWHYGVRVWVTLIPAYLFALVGSVAVPEGPFIRSLPASLPMFALVLTGSRSGWVAAAISVVVIFLTPFLQASSHLTALLAAAPPVPAPAAALVLSQCFGLTAKMLGLMILLEVFHRFLMRSLSAQSEAASRMEQVAFERAEAHRSLAREMEERQRLEREIEGIGDEERRRLGREVHDGVCQQITGALLRCQALERRVERKGNLVSEDLSSLSSLLEEAIDEAQAVARGLSPLAPDPDALAPALRALARRTQAAAGVRCEFATAGDVAVHDPSAAQHLYRIAQEAVSNAVRHASATHIIVTLEGRGAGLFLEVQDNGDGLPESIPSGGLGFRTMACRAQILKGELTMERGAKGGLRVACRVPGNSHPRPCEPSIATTMEKTDGS